MAATTLNLEELDSILMGINRLEFEEEMRIIKENVPQGKMFREAAAKGYLNIVDFFVRTAVFLELTEVERKVCTNRGAADIHGITPLHLAAYHGHTDVVECLILSEGPQVVQDGHPITALYLASREGHLGLVELLIAYIEFSSRQRIDALCIAVYKGHTKVVNCLLAAGTVGDEAMCYAAALGRDEIVALLLANGVDPDAPGHPGRLATCEDFLERNFRLPPDEPSFWMPNIREKTPLWLAFERCHWSVFHLLLKENANVNAEDPKGYTLLDAAIRTRNKPAALALHLFGARFGMKGHYLLKAIQEGNFLAVLSLRALGIDFHKFESREPSWLKTKGMTPLHVACSTGYRDIVKLILQSNVLTDARDTKGNTSLHHACIRGGSDIVKLLVEYGASVNTKNGQGETPLSLSIFHNRNEITEYLLDNDADPNVMCYVKEFGRCAVLDLLPILVPRTDFALINRVNHCTPLHLAASFNNIKIAKLLIECDAQVNALDQSGKPPLYYAQCAEMKQLLLENKAYVLTTNDCK